MSIADSTRYLLHQFTSFLTMLALCGMRFSLLGPAFTTAQHKVRTGMCRGQNSAGRRSAVEFCIDMMTCACSAMIAWHTHAVLFLAFADKLLTMDPKEITYNLLNKKLQKIVLLRVKKLHTAVRDVSQTYIHAAEFLLFCRISS